MTRSVSVVIGTRNHGDSIAETLKSILANDYSPFDVAVVDQSTNELTEVSIAPFLCDSRVRYIRTRTKGLARGQNIGIAATCGELIAITDDDCHVPPDWIASVVEAFAIDSRVGVVLGNVLAAEHDRRAGFTQSYVRSEPYLARSVGEKHLVEGLGANMACRRNVWQALHGFDEMLGAGTRLCAAEETDFIVRALLRGYFVYETPHVSITHCGFRTWESGRPLIKSYMCGLAAMYVKYLKCAQWGAMRPFAHQVWRWAFGKPAADFGRVPSRWLRFGGFAQGLWKGLGTPVDATKCLFKNHYSSDRLDGLVE